MFTFFRWLRAKDQVSSVGDRVDRLASSIAIHQMASVGDLARLREEMRAHLDEIRASNREFVDVLSSLNSRFESVINNVLGYPDCDPNYPAPETLSCEHRFESVISERLDSLTKIIEVLVNDVATKVRLSAEDYAELESGSVQRIVELKEEIHSLAVSLNYFRDEFRAVVSRKSGGQTS